MIFFLLRIVTDILVPIYTVKILMEIRRNSCSIFSLLSTGISRILVSTLMASALKILPKTNPIVVAAMMLDEASSIARLVTYSFFIPMALSTPIEYLFS